MSYYAVIRLHDFSLAGPDQIAEKLVAAMDGFSMAKTEWHSADKMTWFVLFSDEPSPDLGGATGLCFLDGWAGDASGKVLSAQDVARMQDHASLVGEYVAIDVSRQGMGRIVRNTAATLPLYFGECEDLSVVSNRASLVDVAVRFAPTLRGAPAQRMSFSHSFARDLVAVGWSMGDDALFSGVESVSQGAEIAVGQRIAVSAAAGDVWHDEGLRARYAKSPRRYWDDLFERLLVSVDLALSLAESRPLRLNLSGGKDSRVLLGLILKVGRKEQIQALITRGPPFSPDVVVATLIADHYQLPHLCSDNVYGADAFDRMGHLDRHFFLTEGEMSPHDLTYNSKKSESFSLLGQEGGLRSVSEDELFSTEAECWDWFVRHLGGFDRCGVLNKDDREAEESVVRAWFDRAVHSVQDMNDLPTKHRLETRLRRWVARTRSIAQGFGYAPYILCQDFVIKATYNAGVRSRILEDFHYEMLQRSDPWLAKECPFAQQTWHPRRKLRPMPPVPAARHPALESSHGSFAYLQCVADSFVDAVADSVEFVDSDKLRALKGRPISRQWAQNLWQLAPLTAFKSIDRFSMQSLTKQLHASPLLLLDQEVRERGPSGLSDAGQIQKTYQLGTAMLSRELHRSLRESLGDSRQDSKRRIDLGSSPPSTKLGRAAFFVETKVPLFAPWVLRLRDLRHRRRSKISSKRW